MPCAVRGWWDESDSQSCLASTDTTSRIKFGKCDFAHEAFGPDRNDPITRVRSLKSCLLHLSAFCSFKGSCKNNQTSPSNMDHSETKNQPKEEVFGRTSLRTSDQNFGQALQVLENKHFGTDMPRGRPRKNFGLKNFGLIFRSLTMVLFISFRIS